MWEAAAAALAEAEAEWDACCLSRFSTLQHGCQMAKFDPFLSLDCARVEGVGAQSKERKGSNFAAQRSGAIVQKPKGPNTYNLNIWLLPSGNHVPIQILLGKLLLLAFEVFG